MFNIIPLFLLIISLGVIVVLIARKYPELTLLDLDTIPDRKEKQKKKEILTRKASKRSQEQQAKLLDRFAPLGQAWTNTQTSFRKYVKKLKDEVESAKQEQTKKQSQKVAPAQPPVVTNLEKEERVEDILKRGKRALEEGRFQEAESAYISVIEKDAKHAPAYEGLGDVYRAQQQFEEAKETYLFAKKLDAGEASVFIKLASLAEEQEQWVEAIQYYEAAVLIDDTNADMFAKLSELLLKAGQEQAAHEAICQAAELRPKHLPYLDSLTEISILVQDKSRAEEAAQAIRMIDPEYSRLPLLKDRIAEMDES